MFQIDISYDLNNILTGFLRFPNILKNVSICSTLIIFKNKPFIYLGFNITYTKITSSCNIGMDNFKIQLL